MKSIQSSLLCFPNRTDHVLTVILTSLKEKINQKRAMKLEKVYTQSMDK